MASIRLDAERGADLRRLLAETCDVPDDRLPPVDPDRPDLWRLLPRGRRWSGVRFLRDRRGERA